MGAHCLWLVNIRAVPVQSSFIVTIAVMNMQYSVIVFFTVEAYVYGRNSTVPLNEQYIQ
jgi:hypothetical protein